MSELNEFLGAVFTTMGIHGVTNVKLQMQRFNENHVQLKIVIERDSDQKPMEITCFAPAGEPPTWEYLGEWIHPSLEPKNEVE